jgi:hypothetical protein
LAAGALCGFLPALLTAQPDSVAKSAQAIFHSNCAACHGDARMSNLDVRARETILEGGKRGPAIVPGNAEESLLYKAVRREGELKMPPGDASLPASEISALRDWINAGAPWESIPTATSAAHKWWSFQKPERPRVPEPKNASWVRNPIDAFILAKLEQKGLHPAEPADRLTLMRRAYIDLHGLPPANTRGNRAVCQ